MALLLALAFWLRLTALNHTIVIEPIRADAAGYYLYALNIQQSGTFSRQNPTAHSALTPDAVSGPGYPYLVHWLVKSPPDWQMLKNIGLLQAILGTFTVLLTFLLGRMFLPPLLCYGAALLTAISPHLVNSTIYLLSEASFTFLLLAGLYLTARAFDRRSRPGMALAGLLLGAATLTRPVIQYLGLPLAALIALCQRQWKSALFLLLVGFYLPVGLWTVRNLISIHAASDPTLLINTLHHGMYPDMEYQGDANTRGFPYRFDPHSEEISSSLGSVLQEITRRFRTEPGRHLAWYLFGKPRMLLSWDIVSGMGDAFIYPVSDSPYFHPGLHRATHFASKMLHTPLVLASLAGMLVAIISVVRRQTSVPNAHFAAALLAVTLLYFLLLHIVAAPFPRYGIPLRPLIYLLAMYAIWRLSRSLEGALADQTAAATS